MTEFILDTNEELKGNIAKFKLNHYRSIDIDYWLNKTKSLQENFDKEITQKQRNRIVFETYSLYLQILETLFINIYAATLDNSYFPNAIFIDSSNIQKFISDHFLKTTKFSRWFLNDRILAVQKKTKNSKDLHDQYAKLIKVCAKDYVDDYQLLNAYKHGFRVTAVHGNNSVSMVDKNNRNYLLVKGDCKITYFSREIEILKRENQKSKKRQIIYKRSVSFNVERLFTTCAFTIMLLQNLRLSVLYSLGEKPKEDFLQVILNDGKESVLIDKFSFREALFANNIGKEVK